MVELQEVGQPEAGNDVRELPSVYTADAANVLSEGPRKTRPQLLVKLYSRGILTR